MSKKHVTAIQVYSKCLRSWLFLACDHANINIYLNPLTADAVMSWYCHATREIQTKELSKK